MSTMTRTTDGKARVTLPEDFANCVVTIERDGEELRVRKARKRYTFKELMAGVTKGNIHPEVSIGPRVGRESL